MSHGTSHDNPDVERERTDVNVRGIVWFAVWLLASAVVIHVAMWLLFVYFERREARQDPAPSPFQSERPTRPPEPRLQTLPTVDLKSLRAVEEHVASSYGWVDRQAGIVRIPVERAMDLLVERSGKAAQ